jgi:DNA-binding MarR family transcriptional regulator
MTYSYNNQMATSVHPRLENLLAALSLNLAEESQAALERAAGLTGSATVALLALEEFLGDAHVGRVADVLGLTHSGAVRLVTQLEAEGLAVRRTGKDRRRVQVRLTPKGRRRAAAAREARDSVISETTSGLDSAEAGALEALLAKLVETRVAARVDGRRAGDARAWWCRTCDLAACGRPAGRCPAQVTAAALLSE